MSGRSTERTCRGERHPQARLTEDQVREIRYVYARWKDAGDPRGWRSLGRIFGVSGVTAYYVVTRRIWVHVP